THESLRHRRRAEAAADRRAHQPAAPLEVIGGERQPDSRADHGRQRSAVDGQKIGPRAAAQAQWAGALLTLSIGSEFRLRVVAEDVTRHAGERPLDANDHRTRSVWTCLDLSGKPEPVTDAGFRGVGPYIGEVRAQPRAARAPGELR